MIEIRGYIDEQGNKRFADWLMQLATNTAARVTTALARIEQGDSAPATGFISAGTETGS
jgi:hypothetical protein